MDAMPSPSAFPESPLRLLRFASLLEGTTLLALVGLAVPLKHLAQQPLAVTVLGPVHGFAFLFYLWTLLAAVAAGGWHRREIARAIVVAFLPFGAFANVGFLQRKQAALVRSQAAAGDRP